MARILAQLHMPVTAKTMLAASLGTNISAIAALAASLVLRLLVSSTPRISISPTVKSLLVDGFFATEPYFPWARPTDSLHRFFVEALLNKIGAVAGENFIGPVALERNRFAEIKTIWLPNNDISSFLLVNGRQILLDCGELSTQDQRNIKWAAESGHVNLLWTKRANDW